MCVGDSRWELLDVRRSDEDLQLTDCWAEIVGEADAVNDAEA